MAKRFEIFRMDEPGWVSGTSWAEDALDALKQEQRLYPDSVIDEKELTFTNKFGLHGVREVECQSQ